MEYFKVISVIDEKFFSYNTTSSEETNCRKMEQGIILEYKIGEWTRPKIKHSNLFCFPSLKDAKMLADEDNELIFRCEVENPSSKGYWTGLVFDMDYFLKLAEEENKSSISNHIIFDNTIFCDAIKLLEIVK